MKYFFICQLFCLLLIPFLIPDSTYAENENIEIRFSTKHGELIFLNERGKPGVSAVDVKLKGKIILSSRNRIDGEGFPQGLMLPDLVIPYQHSPKFTPMDRPLRIDRLVVQEGPRGNCARQFIIFDFTMDKPYVSERFGDNPNAEYCLMLERIEWGKKRPICISPALTSSSTTLVAGSSVLWGSKWGGGYWSDSL